jgi:hypothetical protein
MAIVTSRAYYAMRHALFAVTALLAASIAHAQNITVAEANSTNDRVYGVNFTAKGITTTIENTDSGSFGSIRSLTFLVNPSTTALDLVVADNAGGKIAVYPGDFSNGAPTTATIIWQASQGGPAAPNGLSVDLAGDLFVVNTGGTPQLWVFPAAGSPACATPLTHYPALCTPLLVDNNYAAGQVLVETTIAPSLPSGGSANTGDLLVLTSNPAAVLDYALAFSSSGITVNRTTLLTLPAGTIPGGLAFWPLDNSLLIANQTTDTVLRYSCCTAPLSAMTPFASNLGGSGLVVYKIKTGYQNGAALAFLAEAGSVGQLLEFGEGNTLSGPGTLLATIAPKGNHPEGVAVTNGGAAAANACTTTAGGCNPTGLLSHNIPQNTAPALAENICVVPVDPRVTITTINNQQVWSCNGKTLPVNQVCPGFDSTGNMIIPGYLCGRSGDSATAMEGFTLIKTQTNDSQINGVVVDNEGIVANEPTCAPAGVETPPGSNPTIAADLWAPLAGQGTFIADGLPTQSNPTTEMLDMVGGCDTHQLSSGGSLWALGLALNLAGIAPEGTNAPSPGGPLGTLGDNKYDDLESQIETILAAPVISQPVAAQLAAVTAGGNVGCVYLSQSYFDFAQLENGAQQVQDYTIAADLLSNADTSNSPMTCDSIVTYDLANVPNAFVPTNGPPPAYNPSGQVRARLANLYFTINSRILGNQPNAKTPAWPPNPAPAAPPSGFSALPPAPDVQNPCVAAGSYPPPGGCPALNVPQTVVAGTPVTASFTLLGSNNAPTGCTLTSADGTFSAANNNTSAKASPQSYPFSGTANGTVPAGTAPGNYLYTLACPYPDTAGAQSVTVSEQVSVLAAPTISASPAPPATVSAGAQVTVTWVLNNSTLCTVISSDPSYPGGSVSNSSSVTYTESVAQGNAITYTLQCSSPSATSATATVNVVAPSTPLTVSVSPAKINDDGQIATITWTAPSSGCKLTDSSSYKKGPGGVLNGTTSSSGAGSFTAYYKSSEPDGGYAITFTASCTSGAPVSAKLSVTE